MRASCCCVLIMLYRVADDAEDVIGTSEGGLSGEDKDEEDRPCELPDLQYTRVCVN